MIRKNVRKTALPSSVTDYTIRRDGGVWHISAKDYPERQIFRVYRVEGDINRLSVLADGIFAMLTEAGIEQRRVEMKF